MTSTPCPCGKLACDCGKASAPPSPRAVLSHVLTTPERLEAIVSEARRIHGTFPEGGSALFAWLVLEHSGMLVPYGMTPDALVSALLGAHGLCGLLTRHRWRAVGPEQAPQAGDLYVGTDERRVPVRLGFVAKAHRQGEETLRDWFLGVDERIAAPWRPVRVACDQVAFYLRQGGG